MKKITLLLLTLLSVTGLTLAVSTPLVSATDLVQDAQCQATDKAQCIDPNTDAAATADCTKDNCDIIAKYINPFMRLLGIVAGLAVTVGIIWGGIEYSSSAGDPQKSASGKKHIVVAVIGLLVYFFLYAALKFLMPAGTTG
jgi:hypothetical protein